jgi:hypothetical protein
MYCGWSPEDDWNIAPGEHTREPGVAAARLNSGKFELTRSRKPLRIANV